MIGDQCPTENSDLKYADGKVLEAEVVYAVFPQSGTGGRRLVDGIVRRLASSTVVDAGREEELADQLRESIYVNGNEFTSTETFALTHTPENLPIRTTP